MITYAALHRPTDYQHDDNGPSDDEYRDMANDIHNEDGVVEVDGYGAHGQLAVVSRSDAGAYVQAWVWVDNPNYDPGADDPIDDHAPAGYDESDFARNT